MVAETAMPYAPASAEDDRNTSTSMTVPTKVSQLAAGT
jgi:hypothetical protein